MNRASVVVLLLTATVSLGQQAEGEMYKVPNNAKFMEMPPEHPHFTEKVQNVTVTRGREAVLTCTVDNLGDYQIAWVRVDTQTILTIHRHIITRNYRIYLRHADHRAWYLHIENVQESDRGWYMCQINTDPMESQKGYLEVVVPPDIVDQETTKDLVVKEGVNATLNCTATGYPTPNIVWRKEDGTAVSMGAVEVPYVEGPSLHLGSVSRMHMGAYLCIASNGIPPSKSKRVILKVEFLPTVYVPHQMVGAYLGQDVILSCQFEAHPKTVNYWAKETGGMIASGKKYITESHENGYKSLSRLRIKSVTSDDYMTYKCYSRNMMGEVYGSIILHESKVLVKPQDAGNYDDDIEGKDWNFIQGRKKERLRNEIINNDIPHPENGSIKEGQLESRKTGLYGVYGEASIRSTSATSRVTFCAATLLPAVWLLRI